jgi:hypothetical protein
MYPAKDVGSLQLRIHNTRKLYLVTIGLLYIHIRRGLYFGPKTIFIPLPPSENDIFPPSCDMSFLDSQRSLFDLILPYFAIILPFYFPFSYFISPFFLLLSPFFLFLLHFLPFSLHLFIFFPQMTAADSPPPPREGGVFSHR